MSVLKRRTRMVNFRLSDDEYESLRSFCTTEGVRSISDFARSAVCRSLTNGSDFADEQLEVRVHELDGKVDALAGTVRQLTELMQTALSARVRKRAEPREAS